MQKIIEIKIRSFVAVFIFIMASAGVLNTAHAAKIVNKQIPYFNGALVLVVNGQTTSNTGVFTADIKDAAGKPYPAMTAEWISATVEMVTMDMGVTKASVVNNGAAKVKIQTQFSMTGQWKLNIKMTTAAGSETHSININVP
jgi:hypothetical protein